MRLGSALRHVRPAGEYNGLIGMRHASVRRTGASRGVTLLSTSAYRPPEPVVQVDANRFGVVLRSAPWSAGIPALPLTRSRDLRPSAHGALVSMPSRRRPVMIGEW